LCPYKYGGIPIVKEIVNYRETVSKLICYELDEESFKECSRGTPKKVFVRDRILTFKNLILLILTMKSSLQRDLDRFFKTVNDSEYNIRTATKGALSIARKKLNPWAFQRLNEVAVNAFYAEADYYTFGGHRLLSVDGSRLVLPNHKSIKEEFGEHCFGPNADSKRSLAICSTLYDAFNHLTIDAQLAPYCDSEVSLLMKHLDKVKSGDLLLLDRGYPSFWLLFLLKAREIEFCVRLKEDWWLQVKQFTESDLLDKEVVFTLPKKDRDKLSDYPDCQNGTITCRLIKVILEDGSVEILCTSLLDTAEYPYECFAELYHYRWGSEETYKLLKCRAEVENFTGKTAIAVKQDFFAKIFLMTLCAIYSFPIEEKVRQEYQAEEEERKHSQQINHTNALSMTQDILIGVFIKNQFQTAIKYFDAIVEKTKEIIRPGRKVARNKKQKKLYSMNYKRL
jgi:hypothetical protein